MKVIIPLAGKGTRMRPFTHTLAKPLFPIAGKPAMDYIIEELEKLDVSEIIFITGHLKEQIEAHARKYKFKTRFIEQKVKDGTAGAINLAKDYVDEPVLVIFVDTLFDADLSVIKKLKEDGIIWGAETDDPKRFGIIEKKGDLMVGIEEKPEHPKTNLANIGMHYAKDYKIMFECIAELYKKNMTNKGEYYLTDAIQLMIEKGSKIRVEKVRGWYDCGKYETTLETNQHYVKLRNKKVKAKDSKIIEPVYIEDGVQIQDSTIGPNASISKGARITSSRIKNSIILENAVLEKADIVDSIIGSDTKVSDVKGTLYIGDHSSIKNEDSS